MEPALRPGDRLLVLPAGPNGLPWLRGAPRAGSVVIVEREGRFDVKRVGGITGGALWLLGDNAAASSDSRASGPVTVEFKPQHKSSIPNKVGAIAIPSNGPSNS